MVRGASPALRPGALLLARCPAPRGTGITELPPDRFREGDAELCRFAGAHGLTKVRGGAAPRLVSQGWAGGRAA